MTTLAERPAVDLLLDRATALSEQFAADAAEYDRTAAFPFANFDALYEADLLRLTVPVAHGGFGLGVAPVARIVEQIARGDASTALVFAMHCIYHAVFAAGNRWPAGLAQQVYGEVLAGPAMINVMRVEPELGTPARGGLPRTTAERTADGWRLTGHKSYCTGAPILRHLAVWCRTAGDDPRVGYLLVPGDAPGIRMVETWDHMGMRATGSHDLYFEGVEAPEDHALDLRPPAAWQGPDPAIGAWNGVVLAALYHGVARAARDWLVGYLHQRVPANLGASLATLPRFQSAVGEIDALLYANDRLIHGLAERIDAGDPAAGGETSFVKYLANANAIKAVDIALALIGNPGLSRHHPLERHHRDVLCSRIHTPQDDMVTLGAGKSALGIA